MPVILNPRNAALVRVDEAKVKRLMGQPKVLASPLLGVVENGKIWLINGYHRLAAMGRGRIACRASAWRAGFVKSCEGGFG